MGFFKTWQIRRIRRLFDEIGADCIFRGVAVEVKGHVRLGEGCVLGNNLLFRTHKDGAIVVGDGAEVDDYSLLLANSRIEIGAGAYLGPYCVLRDTNHLFQGTDVHWRLTPHITEPIVVGPNCFVGARSYLMPGVTLGEGCVIGPASVVTKPVPVGEIWAGSPARLVAHRTDPTRRAKFKRDLELAGLFGLTLDSDIKG